MIGGVKDLNRHNKHGKVLAREHCAQRMLSTAAVRGEVRFYKKRFAHRSHDLFIRVLDCRCNQRDSGNAAHKAQAGIARLEGKRADWATIHHCASCTGGGMWSIRW
jgi:hypothetical protein